METFDSKEIFQFSGKFKKIVDTKLAFSAKWEVTTAHTIFFLDGRSHVL